MGKGVRRVLVVGLIVVVGCVSDAPPEPGGRSADDQARFALSAGSLTTASLVPGRAAVVESHGRGAQPLMRLNVGAGAIARPVELTIREIEGPWGNVGLAYEIGPTGLEFAEPVTLEFDLESIELPPGTPPGSLRVATVENGRWVPIGPAAGGDPLRMSLAGVPPRVVSAQIRHLSPYGLVADPREVTGVGRTLESNGIVAVTADDVYGRLFVSSTIVTLYIDGGTVRSTRLTLSGLPTDESHVLYVDGIADMRTIVPADGGTVTVDLDLSSPRLLWLQEVASTVIIGGPDDECATVGTWTDATTCTLTMDVMDNLVVAQAGVTLDCDGHQITPPQKPPPAISEILVDQSAGIMVSKIQDVAVRRCNVGRSGEGFGIGIWVYYSTNVEVADCVLTENMQGIVVEASTGARLHENQVRGSWVSGIAVQDLPTKTVDEVPPPLPSHEISGNTIEMGLDSKSTGIDLRGSPVRFMSGVSGAPTNGLPPLTVHDNVVSGGGNAVTLASVADAEIRRNDLDDPVRGLLILDDGWPNRFYHNNVTATDVGVTDGRTQGGMPPSGPVTNPYSYRETKDDRCDPMWGICTSLPPPAPIDVSWEGEGSWWGHTCAFAPLFLPGVDSSAMRVYDGHPYGARDAWFGGVAPGCPGDADGDTVPDGADNCPVVPNPGQQNVDGVAEGDACDLTPPDAPVIATPTAWQKFPTGSVAIAGTAEPRSHVSISDAGEPVGTTATDHAGLFVFMVPSPLTEGPHYAIAAATDAAGNMSLPSPLVPFGIDTIPPKAPTHLYPRAGEIIPTRAPTLTGKADPDSTVRIYDNDALVATAIPTPYGDFSTLPTDPLADGEHHFNSTATDGAGWVSERGPVVSVTVKAISSESPVVSTGGMLSLVSLSDAPDPFDPNATDPSSTLRADVQVAPTAGLAGTSPNHAFVVNLSWTIREALTGRLVNHRTTSSTLDRGSPAPQHVRLAARWDGTDLDGATVPSNTLYEYDVSIHLVRLWTGPGRGPRCGRTGSLPPETIPGRAACLLDEIRVLPAGTVKGEPLPKDIAGCTTTESFFFTEPVVGCHDWVTGPASANRDVDLLQRLSDGTTRSLGNLWATDQGWPVVDPTDSDLRLMVYGDTSVHSDADVVLYDDCVSSCDMATRIFGPGPTCAPDGGLLDRLGAGSDDQCLAFFAVDPRDSPVLRPCEYLCATLNRRQIFNRAETDWSNAVFFEADVDPSRDHNIALGPHLPDKHVLHSTVERSPLFGFVGVYTYDYFYVCPGDTYPCDSDDMVLYFVVGTTSWDWHEHFNLLSVAKAMYLDGTGIYRFGPPYGPPSAPAAPSDPYDPGCRILFADPR